MWLCRNFASLFQMKCIGKHVSAHLKKTQNEINPLASRINEHVAPQTIIIHKIEKFVDLRELLG